MRTLPVLLLLTFLLAPATAVAESVTEDFRIVLSNGMSPKFEGFGASATLTKQVPGEVLEWNITTTKTRLIGRVESDGYFNIERPEQMLPDVDDNFPEPCKPDSGWPERYNSWHFFAPAYESTVLTSGECAHLVNVTGEAPNPRFLLAFPVNATKGNATLRLSHDVTAPGFSMGTVQNINHYSFYFETTTTEWAYASLVIREKNGGEPVENPTAIPSLLQRFPVQGLDPATDHVFHVEFWDWSGNRARSEEVNVTTAPKPLFPAPEVLSVTPAPDSTVETVSEIGVEFREANGTVTGVSFFLDKEAVSPDIIHIDLGTSRASFVPQEPVAPGPHKVLVEISNSLGGRVSKQWTFHVEAEKSTPAPGMVLLLAAIGAALLSRRR